MSKIFDKYLAIEIDDKGSTLKSFFDNLLKFCYIGLEMVDYVTEEDKKSNKELLWQGDEKSWTG